MDILLGILAVIITLGLAFLMSNDKKKSTSMPLVLC